MQAAGVPNLQTNAVLQSQTSSMQVQYDFNSSGPKTSFDEMIQKARKTEEPVKEQENKVSYANETKEVSSDEKKVLEQEKVPEEKNSVVSERTDSKTEKVVKEKSDKKTALKTEQNVSETSKKDFQKINVSEKDAEQLKEKPQIKESFVKISGIIEKSGAKNQENIQKTEQQEEIPVDFDLSDVESIVSFLNNETVPQNESLLMNDFMSDSKELNQDFENEIKASGKTYNFDKDGKIKVHDFRKEAAAESGKSEIKSDKNPLKVTDVKFDGKNSAEMTLEVASNVQQNVFSSSDQTAGSASSDFHQMLVNQLQQNAGDIVKAGNIVLKDNDAGSIKLILHPESLGNVKIDLQISDKNITGRIVVASQEAYNAFKESVDSLKQAFINSGFESAGLDLSFAGQNAESGNFARNQEEQDSRFVLNRGYGNLSEDAGLDYDENFIEISTRNSVNIVA